MKLQRPQEDNTEELNSYIIKKLDQENNYYAVQGEKLTRDITIRITSDLATQTREASNIYNIKRQTFDPCIKYPVKLPFICKSSKYMKFERVPCHAHLPTKSFERGTTD